MHRGAFFTAYSYSLFLWIAASLPGDDLQKIQVYPKNPLFRIILSDPCMHFIIFGLLTLFICRGYEKPERSIPFIKVALIAGTYGFLIEVYQGILPWRSFGLDDVIWDIGGVLFFWHWCAYSGRGGRRW